MRLGQDDINKIKPIYHEDGRRDLIDEINQCRDIIKLQSDYIRRLKLAFREVIMYYHAKPEHKALLREKIQVRR